MKFIDLLEKRIILLTRKKKGLTPTWSWEADNAEEVAKYHGLTNEIKGLRYALKLLKGE